MRRQRGVALLILFLLLAVTGLTLFVTAHTDIRPRLDQMQRSQQALRWAREALIGYAVNYPEISGTRGPGFLPCPDTDGNGVPNPPCSTGGVGTVGQLPWKTLGIDQLRDGTGAPLWYAVSNNFANFPGSLTINSDTRGSITLRNSGNAVINNGTDDSAVVAVVIAPGSPLQRQDGFNQTGRASQPYNPRQFLDIAYGEDNANFTNNTLNGFIMGPVRDAAGHVIANDLVLPITRGELLAAVEKRVAGDLRDTLNAYRVACGVYPWAAPYGNPLTATYTSSPSLREGLLPVVTALPYNWGASCASGNAPTLPAWFTADDWQAVSYYALAPAACTPGVNCLTVQNAPAPNNNVNALVILDGPALAGQTRPSGSPGNYLEGQNASPGDDVFERNATSSSFNDQLRIVSP
ncbi:MAG: hypothetical protein P8Y78_13555 [Acidihalobacter sp.]